MNRPSQQKKLAREDVAVCEHSNWGVIEVTGEDRLQFLHNQTTNEIKSLKAGQGCRTVFVNGTARTLDLATVYVTEEKVLLIVSPQRTQFLMEWLDRYLFPMDRVSLKNVSEEFSILTLLGKKSPEFLEKLGLNLSVEEAFATHQTKTMQEISVRVAVGTEIAIVGYTLLVSSEQVSTLKDRFLQEGAIAIEDRVWEELTLEQGRPLPDYELTEDYNPLEAGLWEAISFDKGCYIGQETMARLNTYQGVKQRLWGLQLSQAVPLETPVTCEGKKIGKLTRIQETEEGVMALAYIRTKAGGENLTVEVGDAQGKVVAVPFLSHPLPAPLPSQLNTKRDRAG